MGRQIDAASIQGNLNSPPNERHRAVLTPPGVTSDLDALRAGFGRELGQVLCHCALSHGRRYEDTSNALPLGICETGNDMRFQPVEKSFDCKMADNTR